jgi:ketosteroid isomerase-like protein
MSGENVELVRRAQEAGQRSLDAYWRDPRSGVAALEAGDLPPETEAFLAFLHPEVEYNAVPAALEGGTARGHVGWLRSWDAFLSQMDDGSVEVKEVADLGGDQVLAVSELTAKWKGSGMELSEPRFTVITVRDRLIVRINAYRDREEALEAAGLSE